MKNLLFACLLLASMGILAGCANRGYAEKPAQAPGAVLVAAQPWEPGQLTAGWTLDFPKDRP